jgi:hypothetical protein
MDTKKYICNICNKNYKSTQSLWNHKNKYHPKNPHFTHNLPTIYKDELQNTHILPTYNENNKKDKTICEYCNKNYSSYNSMNRHIQKCKIKEKALFENEELKKQNDELKKEYEEMKQSLDEMKTMMLEMMNNKCKMHPKTLQKLINSNNINSNNNITIINNNQINIIELGDENLNNVFSKEEKLKILKCGFGSLEEIIRYTHLNNNYLQFQNIIITNKRNNEAYMYSGGLKKFILVNKNDLLEELIIYRFDDLASFYEDNKNKLDKKLQTNLEKMFKLKDDDDYNKRKLEEFNIIIYNECNKELLKNECNLINKI